MNNEKRIKNIVYELFNKAYEDYKRDYYNKIYETLSIIIFEDGEYDYEVTYKGQEYRYDKEIKEIINIKELVKEVMDQKENYKMEYEAYKKYGYSKTYYENRVKPYLKFGLMKKTEMRKYITEMVIEKMNLIIK